MEIKSRFPLVMAHETKTRTKRAKSGDFVRVPIDKTRWSYGRVCNDGTIAIYDIITTQTMMTDEIISRPILFRVPMMRFAFNGKEWPIIGHLPLEEELQQPAEFLSIRTWQNTKGNFYGVTMFSGDYLISHARAKELELMASYEPIHVVQRLLLHAEGQLDPQVELARIK